MVPLVSFPVSTNEALRELPASAKLVYKVLENEGELTPSQIAEETRLSDRTVRHALTKLDAANLVTEGISLVDARRKFYKIQTSSAATSRSE